MSLIVADVCAEGLAPVKSAEQIKFYLYERIDETYTYLGTNLISGKMTEDQLKYTLGAIDAYEEVLGYAMTGKADVIWSKPELK